MNEQSTIASMKALALTAPETMETRQIPMPSHLDDTAIRQALQLPPATALEQGVRETIERFQLLQREGRLDSKDLDS